MAAQYKIYGTNEPYSGNVIQLGNRFYTTTGNVLEGDSKELVVVSPETGNSGEDLVTLNTNTAQPTTTTNNPVTSTFFAPNSPRYYRPDGSLVAIGAPLHQHADGTVMTEHSMGPNDNSVVVTISPPPFNGQILGQQPAGGNGGNGRMGGQANTQTTNQGNQGGGNMGGGGSY